MKVSAKGGFSLAEVVVAVGVFAFSITGILGLLGWIGTGVRDVETMDDEVRAVRLMRVLEEEFRGFNGTQMLAVLSRTDPFYATRGGTFYSDKDTPSGTAADVNDGDRYFEIKVVRDAEVSPVGNDATAGFIAYAVSVRWPLPEQVGTESRKRVDWEKTIVERGVWVR